MVAVGVKNDGDELAGGNGLEDADDVENVIYVEFQFLECIDVCQIYVPSVI